MAEISDYLKELEEQDVQEEKSIVVIDTPSPVVEYLIEVAKHIWWNRSVDLTYGACWEKTRNLNYSQKDINEFLIRSEKRSYDYGVLGIYVSALINNCKEQDIEIVTQYLKEPIDNLCYGNKKNVTIMGGVGSRTGKYMSGGKLVIHGSALHATGSKMRDGLIIVKGSTRKYPGAGMSGGKLIIEENAEDFIGDEMTGGEIIIEGDVGKNVGRSMDGGKIYLNGRYKSIGDSSGRIFGGRLYCKNKRIAGNFILDLLSKFRKWDWKITCKN